MSDLTMAEVAVSPSALFRPGDLVVDDVTSDVYTVIDVDPSDPGWITVANDRHAHIAHHVDTVHPARLVRDTGDTAGAHGDPLLRGWPR